MPRATFNPNATTRFELKTCPPDGFIVVRRLSLGESAKREQATMKMALQGADAKTRQMNIDPQITALLEFDFATMIVEHNLEDEHGNLLNFKNPADVSRLDGPIGEEIKKCLDEVSSAAKVDEETKN